MITLYGSGPNFGLPDASPFVSKVEVLLKMAGATYRRAEANFSTAPKGKIPYITDEHLMLGDSTFIRFYLEKKLGVDFDKGLTPDQRAASWAFEKMCEEHLYWAIVHARWMDSVNFDKGPRVFFKKVPLPLRPFIVSMVKRSVKRNLYGHGMGRHNKAEIEALAARDLDAVSSLLGRKPWLMGDIPCAADAAVWSLVASALCPHFETPIRTEAEKHPNLVAYRDRGMARWFADLKA